MQCGLLTDARDASAAPLVLILLLHHLASFLLCWCDNDDDDCEDDDVLQILEEAQVFVRLMKTLKAHNRTIKTLFSGNI